MSNRQSPIAFEWHQTVIGVLGLSVAQWDAGVATKFLALSTASLLVTVLLCELMKQTNLTRLLFGMKPRPIWYTLSGAPNSGAPNGG